MTEPAALTLTITRTGMDRFTAAQLGEDIDLAISSVGLTASVFPPAPTLTALPGEFRRLATISGEQIGDSIIHMMIRDEATISYSARGFGLYFADGTLFATYGQANLLFEKSPRAALLAAIDIGFPTGDIDQLTFGSTDFLNPPATTETMGVVELATDAEADDGADLRVITARQLTRLATTLRAEVSAVIGIVLGKIDDVATAIRTEFATALRLSAPIGAITLWYGAEATVPAGWAICDGRVVARSDGTGSIATPDMRGRVPVGFTGGLAVGETFGERVRTIATADSGQHSHAVDLAGTTDVKSTGTSLTIVTNTTTAGGGTGTSVRSVDLVDPGHDHAVTTTGATADAGAHSHTVEIDVAQPSIVLLYIMRV